VVFDQPVLRERPVLVEEQTFIKELPRDIIVEPQEVIVTPPIIEVEPPIIEKPIIHNKEFVDVYVQESMYSNGPHLPYLDDTPNWVPGRNLRN